MGTRAGAAAFQGVRLPSPPGGLRISIRGQRVRCSSSRACTAQGPPWPAPISLAQSYAHGPCTFMVCKGKFIRPWAMGWGVCPVSAAASGLIGLVALGEWQVPFASCGRAPQIRGRGPAATAAGSLREVLERLHDGVRPVPARRDLALRARALVACRHHRHAQPSVAVSGHRLLHETEPPWHARHAANWAVVGRAQESQLGPTGCELTAEITPTGVVRRSSRNTRCGRSRVANLATQPDDAKKGGNAREAKRIAVDDGRP